MSKYSDENLKILKELEADGVDIRKLSALQVSGIFSCSKCGGHVSLPNIKFFDYKVDEVKCYICQGLADPETGMRIDKENKGVPTLFGH